MNNKMVKRALARKTHLSLTSDTVRLVIKNNSPTLALLLSMVFLYTGLMNIGYAECIRKFSSAVLTLNGSGLLGTLVVFLGIVLLCTASTYLQKTRSLCLRQQLLDALEEKSIQTYFERRSWRQEAKLNEIFPSLRNDLTAYADGLVDFLINTMGAAISLVLVSIYAIALQPLVWISAVLLSCLSMGLSIFCGRNLPKENERLRYWMGALYSSGMELVQNREVTQTLNIDKVVAPYQRNVEDYKKDQRKILSTMNLQRILGSFNMILNTSVVLMIGCYAIVQKTLTISDLIALLVALSALASALYSIPSCIAGYRQLKGLKSRIDAIHEVWEDNPGTKAMEGVSSIELRELSFAYGQEDFVLRNLNVTIHKGDILLLTGASGSGKSTLLQLCAYCLGTYGGSILCDGVELREIERSSYWKHVLFLDQSPQFLSGTLREQITLFGDCCEERLRYAIEAVGLETLIQKLTSGVDTEMQELNLSSGEQQRLCLARAFYGDHDVLLLDEPLSAIDPDSRRQIFGTLLESAIRKGQIVLLSSHADLEWMQQLKDDTHKIGILNLKSGATSR